MCNNSNKIKQKRLNILGYQTSTLARHQRNMFNGLCQNYCNMRDLYQRHRKIHPWQQVWTRIATYKESSQHQRKPPLQRHKQRQVITKLDQAALVSGEVNTRWQPGRTHMVSDPIQLFRLYSSVPASPHTAT